MKRRDAKKAFELSQEIDKLDRTIDKLVKASYVKSEDVYLILSGMEGTTCSVPGVMVEDLISLFKECRDVYVGHYKTLNEFNDED